MAFNFNEDGGIVILAGAKVLYSSRDVNPGAKFKASMKSNVSTGSKVRASAKAKRVVEFPIFDKMMEIEIDAFWKSLFDEAATGKFPRNFKYQNSVLNYKIRSKTIEQEINEENLEECIEITKKFLLEHAGIQSPEDRRRKKLEEEKRIAEMLMNENVAWNQIRSEKQRMIMISLFVEGIGKKYNLSVEERKGLVQNIRIGMLAGYFNVNNIEISGTRIVDIHGLEYNEETREFEINKEVCKLSRIPKRYMYDTPSENTCTTINDGDELQGSPYETPMDADGSGSSSQSLKKRFNKFLSDISKKV
jgi:hypothetical protein